MAKYSFEFKKRVVEAYLNGEGSYAFLTQKYGMPPGKDIRKWVNAYNAFGNEALLRSRSNKHYSFDFKLYVVELYLTTDISYQELAIAEGIVTPTVITRWVSDFKAEGPGALRPKKKGRKTVLKSTKKSPSQPSTESREVDTSAEHVKLLEDELLKLRIENAYLKELRRLRLEEEALLKKQRESSTTSEETSN